MKNNDEREANVAIMVENECNEYFRAAARFLTFAVVFKTYA